MKQFAAALLALLILATGCTREAPAYTPPDHPDELAPAAPAKDFFTGAEFLDLNGIGRNNVEAITLHAWFEDGTEGEVLLTDRASIQEVYQTFADTEIAWDIMLNTNPSTGEQLDMDWHLADGTVLRFYMRYYLGIGGIDATFLFSSGASQDEYIGLYKQYADT